MSESSDNSSRNGENSARGVKSSVINMYRVLRCDWLENRIIFPYIVWHKIFFLLSIQYELSHFRLVTARKKWPRELLGYFRARLVPRISRGHFFLAVTKRKSDNSYAVLNAGY